MRALSACIVYTRIPYLPTYLPTYPRTGRDRQTDRHSHDRTYVRTYKCTYAHTDLCTCMLAYTYLCIIHKRKVIYKHVYIYICVCVPTRICTLMHMPTHTHTRLHVCLLQAAYLLTHDLPTTHIPNQPNSKPSTYLPACLPTCRHTHMHIHIRGTTSARLHSALTIQLAYSFSSVQCGRASAALAS